MERIASHDIWLRYLATAVPSQRNQLLRYATREQISLISELCVNLLHGNINLSEKAFSELSRYKGAYRKLASTCDAVTKRHYISKHSSAIKRLVISFLNDYDKLASSEHENDDDDDDDDDDDYDDYDDDDDDDFCSSEVSNNGHQQRISGVNFDSNRALPTADDETSDPQLPHGQDDAGHLLV